MTTRAYRAILAGQWAIEADWLPALAALAARQDAPELAALRERRGHLVGQPQAYDDDGRPAERRRSYAMRNGVAIVPVMGPIFPRANMMTEYSGATSVSLLERQLREARADPETRAILLDVDSPGGVATDIAAFGDLLYGSRGAKPIAAYVRGAGASAAYWIASAVPQGELWVAETGYVGSIGVVTGVEVQEEPDGNGRRRIEVVSSNARNKRPDPTTDDGLAEIRRTLDALETRFVAAVARNRGVSAEHVIAHFGQGGVEVGSDAVRIGMADRVGSFDQVLAHLAARAASSRETRRMTIENDQPVTAESLAGTFPAQVAEIRTAAAAAERTRILGIEAQALPGHEALIATLKADGKTTPEQAAVAILAAEKQSGARILAGLQQDGQQPAPPPSTGAPPVPAAADPSVPLETRAKAAWEASAAIQAEFRTFAAYHNYLKATEGGRVRAVGRAG
ncbi:hypothetical protein STVA_41520 [Allostella vacuolata]|nr:hypothetical protein STVA_41520 [Stella vacuolata]